MFKPEEMRAKLTEEEWKELVTLSSQKAASTILHILKEQDAVFDYLSALFCIGFCHGYNLAEKKFKKETPSV